MDKNGFTFTPAAHERNHTESKLIDPNYGKSKQVPQQLPKLEYRKNTNVSREEEEAQREAFIRKNYARVCAELSNKDKPKFAGLYFANYEHKLTEEQRRERGQAWEALFEKDRQDLIRSEMQMKFVEKYKEQLHKKAIPIETPMTIEEMEKLEIELAELKHEDECVQFYKGQLRLGWPPAKMEIDN